jgi:hypothetical protein
MQYRQAANRYCRGRSLDIEWLDQSLVDSKEKGKTGIQEPAKKELKLAPETLEKLRKKYDLGPKIEDVDFCPEYDNPIQEGTPPEPEQPSKKTGDATK